MTKTLTSKLKPSSFASAFQGIVPDPGKLFSRFSAAQPEGHELPDRLRFDMGQLDIDPDRVCHSSSSGENIEMMRLRSI